MTRRGGAPRAEARRVLMIVENLPVPFDRRVWQEAKTLRANGYGVSVICPKGRGYEAGHEVIDGIAVYRHPLPFEADGALGYVIEYGLATFFQFLLAWRVFLTRGFDVVHACNPPDTIFIVGGFFKLLFGRRFIFDHHDLSPELYVAKRGGRRGPLYGALVFFERMTYRTADVSIATNDSYRQVAIERAGMSPDRVYVVRSGPAMRHLEPREPNPKVRRGRRHLVSYVGIMGAQDGVPLLLEAAREVVHGHGRDDVQFVLVGSGTEFPRIAQLTRELGLGEHVTLTGLLPPNSDELLDILATADIGVSPDPPSEMNDKSTMNKTLEYMAHGMPLVQFDLTEGRVSAGDAALYAEGARPDDLARKILQLLDNADLRESMGRIGRERIERLFSWERQEPELLAAYDHAFGAPARRRQYVPEERAVE
ncbi:MAG: glycosyltransferase family 4 protein [Dehalococcoidia bacterium]